ncbi:hypothetical protein Lsan_2168 [Legionella santicrucis]|uniref:Uncharacterized protein n=1 Tax=Legionella santicrucis TaxID=45074 RepID=A0A0W0YRQ9_9GAMM|nr:hypothetical protein [Legionella santicrucis]KTD59577.1 hypothetical protein Lsan_2168 [Legionella santicrucis]
MMKFFKQNNAIIIKKIEKNALSKSVESSLNEVNGNNKNSILKQGQKVVGFTKYRISKNEDGSVSVYTPNIIYSQKMEDIREEMRERGCGFGLFKVNKKLTCPSIDISELDDSPEAKEILEHKVDYHLLEPIKLLQDTPPPNPISKFY